MIYVFDLDGTLCHTRDGQYEEAVPIQERISYVNTLYWCGHEIRVYTARGSETGKDWRELTERQLKEWGLRYHRLDFKPYGDVYVDDRAIHPAYFFRNSVEA